LPASSWAAIARTRDAEHRAGRAEAEREERARQAVAEERRRVARELHDVVAHAISVIVLIDRLVLDRNHLRGSPRGGGGTHGASSSSTSRLSARTDGSSERMSRLTTWSELPVSVKTRSTHGGAAQEQHPVAGLPSADAGLDRVLAAAVDKRELAQVEHDKARLQPRLA
jgi:hypothetical protein